jgi:hypothetical protein
LPRQTLKLLRTVENVFSQFARRKTLSIMVLFFAVIGVRLAILPLLPVPAPGIHDEYGYLLLGDTLAHGRLTNPPHPMWISFESFHVIWLPTYCSKFFPGQGLFLALGQWLGQPWFGVLLSVAAMCAAVLWMLQAWLPARWALLGGVLVALKFGIASYWMNSYWGGAAAAIGGALVLGAMQRIVRRGRTRDGLLFGFGLAILANMRPYEGFLFCLPVACWFLWWLAGKTKSRVPARERLVRAFLPVAAVLALTLAFMAYYNWRLTGNALLLPHTLHDQTYRSLSDFVWQHPRPLLQYHNRQFEDFFSGWEHLYYDYSWRSFARASLEKVRRGLPAYLWSGCVLLCPALPFALLDRKMRLPLIIFFVVAGGFLLVIGSLPHYIAPLTCVIFLMLVQAIRRLRTMRPLGRPLGLALSWAVVFLLPLEAGYFALRHEYDPAEWTRKGEPRRVEIAEKLSRTPGKHLIMVRYTAKHNPHAEWVFNGAEIDTAKILWARELDASQNARLLAYFKDRQIWLVEPDIHDLELVPYQPPPAQK